MRLRGVVAVAREQSFHVRCVCLCLCLYICLCLLSPVSVSLFISCAGRGKFSTVFRAKVRATGEMVALKKIQVCVSLCVSVCVSVCVCVCLSLYVHMCVYVWVQAPVAAPCLFTQPVHPPIRFST